MDRISDSGSDGCGSIPHGGTYKIRKGSSRGTALSDCSCIIILEKEAYVDVEGSVSVLLVEAACVFECHDEVLVHDET